MPLMIRESDLLLQFVSERDMPCPVCGYNLRSSNCARCQECGRTLRLAIAVDEMLYLPWLLAMVACWSTIFFSFLLGCSLWSGARFAAWEWVIALISFALSAAGLPLL